MRRANERRGRKRVRRRPGPATKRRGRLLRAGLAVVSLVLFAYLTYSLVTTGLAVACLNREIAQMEQLLQEEEETQTQLQERIDLLQDPDYVEIEAREKLGLIRPGEVLYRWTTPR